METDISITGRLIYLGSRPRRFARAWRHRSGSSRRICLSGACILRSRRWTRASPSSCAYRIRGTCTTCSRAPTRRVIEHRIRPGPAGTPSPLSAITRASVTYCATTAWTWRRERRCSPSSTLARTERAPSAADWLAEHGEGVTAGRPLAYVAEDAVVLYPRVVGAPLSERLQRPGAGVAECLERAGAALHALHHLPPAVAGPLKLHDFAAEVSEIAREASDHIPALLPSVGPAIEGLLARAGELHERLSPEPPTFTHGDFKSEHIWAAPGGFTFIDFDGCRLADPAYDVGKFLADLQLWFTAYDQEGLEQVQEQFLAGYAPRAPQERLLRARLYEAVQLVKIARRVPLFDRDWAALTKQVIRRAQAVMNDLELTLGLPATPSFLGFLDWSHNRHRTRRERRRQRCRKGAWG